MYFLEIDASWVSNVWIFEFSTSVWFSEDIMCGVAALGLLRNFEDTVLSVLTGLPSPMSPIEWVFLLFLVDSKFGIL